MARRSDAVLLLRSILLEVYWLGYNLNDYMGNILGQEEKELSESLRG